MFEVPESNIKEVHICEDVILGKKDIQYVRSEAEDKQEEQDKKDEKLTTTPSEEQKNEELKRKKKMQ
jgi:hypothetical protein